MWEDILHCVDVEIGCTVKCNRNIRRRVTVCRYYRQRSVQWRSPIHAIFSSSTTLLCFAWHQYITDRRRRLNFETTWRSSTVSLALFDVSMASAAVVLCQADDQLLKRVQLETSWMQRVGDHRCSTEARVWPRNVTCYCTRAWPVGIVGQANFRPEKNPHARKPFEDWASIRPSVRGPKRARRPVYAKTLRVTTQAWVELWWSSAVEQTTFKWIGTASKMINIVTVDRRYVVWISVWRCECTLMADGRVI